MVAPEFPPAVGGMEVHADQVTRYLARRHAVTVLVPRGGAPSEPLPATGSVLPVLTHRFGPSLRRARRESLRAGPDAVLAMNAAYASLGGLVPCPLVTRVVGNDFYRAWIGPHLPLRFLFWRLPTSGALSPGRWFRRLDQRYRNRRVQRGLRHSAIILSNSGFTSRALEECGLDASRTLTIVGGVDTARFRPRPRAEARRRLGLPPGPILITVSRLAPKKGIGTVLDALPRVIREHPSLTYLVAGRGEEEAALRARAAALGISARVRFLGTLDHALLPDYLAAVDLFVQCSLTAIDPLTGSKDVETMGRAVCEAHACGLPALVTRSGGLPDVVVDGETGRLVPEGDAPAIASALLEMLRDASLREAMGRAAAERARLLFGWDVVGRRTEEAILAAVAQARASGSHA